MISRIKKYIKQRKRKKEVLYIIPYSGIAEIYWNDKKEIDNIELKKDFEIYEVTVGRALKSFKMFDKATKRLGFKNLLEKIYKLW